MSEELEIKRINKNQFSTSMEKLKRFIGHYLSSEDEDN